MKQIEKRKSSLRKQHKAKKGELIISLQGKGEKDSILEKARQQCLQLYLEDGITINEKVLSDRVTKVHQEKLKRVEKSVNEKIE